MSDIFDARRKNRMGRKHNRVIAPDPIWDPWKNDRHFRLRAIFNTVVERSYNAALDEYPRPEQWRERSEFRSTYAAVILRNVIVENKKDIL